jgi:probable rRNA maturation factor
MSALYLAVQYADRSAPKPGPGWMPSRHQVRRWVNATLDAIAPECSSELTVRFSTAKEAAALNTVHRRGDYVPNVLTFNLHDESGTSNELPVMSDIVICMQVVRAQAREQGKKVANHCAHMVVHGVLHAHGYDHQTKAQAALMEDLERFVLHRFRISDPYRDSDSFIDNFTDSFKL